MKILIVHDWAIVRSGIKQVLADEFGPEEITERASVPDRFDMASTRWDLALVAKRWLLKRSWSCISYGPKTQVARLGTAGGDQSGVSLSGFRR